MARTETSPVATRSWSVRRRIAYGLIVAGLSVTLFFGALEGILRLAGYGHATSFHRVVREGDGTRWIRENRDFTLTYFPSALVRRPPAFRLPEKKAPSTYRIFVLGSSAAMGDPEPSFSLARMLETMLRSAYPALRFEVINAAVTAVNSHVVRAIAADCAELEPDLFIIYEGNNEVIGPFGPAAVLTPFARSPRMIKWAVAVKRTRTGQLLGAMVNGLRGGNGTPAEWGGMGMFLEHELAASDPRLEDVRASFAHNLRAIAMAARGAGAGTMVCTVLTNQRDFAPLLSRHRTALSPGELRRWEDAYAAGNEALGTGATLSAEAHYREAWAIDDQFADLAFRLGRTCLVLQHDTAARDFLQLALDLDVLRFRTDSRLNQTIRDVANALPDTMELIDLARDVARTSPHGVVGDETLHEHVHLNFQGTWRVARVWFARVSADLMRRGDIVAAAAEPPSEEEMRTRLGYTTYEQAMIIQEMLRRLAAPPFTAQADHALRLAAWQGRAAHADRLLQRPDTRDALAAIYTRAIAAAPDDWILHRNHGMALVALGSPEAAIPALERARSIIDDDPDTLFALGTALRATQREEPAATVFAALRRLEPRYPGLEK